MRVRSIHIRRLAHLRDIEINLDDADSGFVCLTGANGTGKTQILNAISRAAGALGIAGGSPDYPPASFDYSVVFEFDSEVEEISGYISSRLRSEQYWSGLELPDWSGLIEIRLVSDWDGITVHFQEPLITPIGRGFENFEPVYLFREAIQTLDRFKIMLIGAGRAYSHMHESRSDSSRGNLVDSDAYQSLPFQPPELLYGEWTQHLILQEQRSLRSLHKAYVEGRMSDWTSPYQSINDKISRLFPDIEIIGTHEINGRLMFKTRGEGVEIQALASGEREVVFMLGIMEMLRMNRGVLLIDEPELHLHPSMIREFMSVVSEVAETSQIIVATHSFETIEPALMLGVTIVLSAGDRHTTAEATLPGSAHAQITSALGVPGFGLSGTTYVAVEGAQDRIRASMRFREVFGDSPKHTFLYAGASQSGVLQLIGTLEKVATHRGEPLRILGIVDSDYESQGGSRVDGNVLYLGVREVENLYLDPGVIDLMVEREFRVDRWEGADHELRRLCEKKAGKWVWNYTRHRMKKQWNKPPSMAILHEYESKFKQLMWSDLDGQTAKYTDLISTMPNEYLVEFEEGKSRYQMLLESGSLWKHCDGKTILAELAARLGRQGEAVVLESLIARLWNAHPDLLHDEWITVRDFLERHSEIV